jgi:hypothetical protein
MPVPVKAFTGPYARNHQAHAAHNATIAIKALYTSILSNGVDGVVLAGSWSPYAR